MAVAVVALGITQITGWGTSYYVFSRDRSVATPGGAAVSSSSDSPSRCS
jgi:hypothetical protein